MGSSFLIDSTRESSDLLPRHLFEPLGIVDALEALQVLYELPAVVGEDLLVGGVARPEVEAPLDEAVLAAAGEDTSKAVGVLNILGVEEAASI